MLAAAPVRDMETAFTTEIFTQTQRQALAQDDYVFFIDAVKAEKYDSADMAAIAHKMGLTLVFNPIKIQKRGQRDGECRVCMAARFNHDTFITRTLARAVPGRSYSILLKELSANDRGQCFAIILPFQGKKIQPVLIAQNYFFHSHDSAVNKIRVLYDPAIRELQNRALERKIQKERKELEYLERRAKETNSKDWATMAGSKREQVGVLQQKIDGQKTEPPMMQPASVDPLFKATMTVADSDVMADNPKQMKRMLHKEGGIPVVVMPSPNILTVNDIVGALEDMPKMHGVETKDMVRQYSDELLMKASKTFTRQRIELYRPVESGEGKMPDPLEQQWHEGNREVIHFYPIEADDETVDPHQQAAAVRNGLAELGMTGVTCSVSCRPGENGLKFEALPSSDGDLMLGAVQSMMELLSKTGKIHGQVSTEPTFAEDPGPYHPCSRFVREQLQTTEVGLIVGTWHTGLEEKKLETDETEAKVKRIQQTRQMALGTRPKAEKTELMAPTEVRQLAAESERIAELTRKVDGLEKEKQNLMVVRRQDEATIAKQAASIEDLRLKVADRDRQIESTQNQVKSLQTRMDEMVMQNDQRQRELEMQMQRQSQEAERQRAEMMAWMQRLSPQTQLPQVDPIAAPAVQTPSSQELPHASGMIASPTNEMEGPRLQGMSDEDDEDHQAAGGGSPNSTYESPISRTPIASAGQGGRHKRPPAGEPPTTPSTADQDVDMSSEFTPEKLPNYQGAPMGAEVDADVMEWRAKVHGREQQPRAQCHNERSRAATHQRASTAIRRWLEVIWPGRPEKGTKTPAAPEEGDLTQSPVHMRREWRGKATKQTKKGQRHEGHPTKANRCYKDDGTTIRAEQEAWACDASWTTERGREEQAASDKPAKMTQDLVEQTIRGQPKERRSTPCHAANCPDTTMTHRTAASGGSAPWWAANTRRTAEGRAASASAGLEQIDWDDDRTRRYLHQQAQGIASDADAAAPAGDMGTAADGGAPTRPEDEDDRAETTGGEGDGDGGASAAEKPRPQTVSKPQWFVGREKGSAKKIDVEKDISVDGMPVTWASARYDHMRRPEVLSETEQREKEGAKRSTLEPKRLVDPAEPHMFNDFNTVKYAKEIDDFATALYDKIATAKGCLMGYQLDQVLPMNSDSILKNALKRKVEKAAADMSKTRQTRVRVPLVAACAILRLQQRGLAPTGWHVKHMSGGARVGGEDSGCTKGFLTNRIVWRERALIEAQVHGLAELSLKQIEQIQDFLGPDPAITEYFLNQITQAGTDTEARSNDFIIRPKGAIEQARRFSTGKRGHAGYQAHAFDVLLAKCISKGKLFVPDLQWSASEGGFLFDGPLRTSVKGISRACSEKLHELNSARIFFGHRRYEDWGTTKMGEKQTKSQMAGHVAVAVEQPQGAALEALVTEYVKVLKLKALKDVTTTDEVSMCMSMHTPYMKDELVISNGLTREGPPMQCGRVTKSGPRGEQETMATCGATLQASDRSGRHQTNLAPRGGEGTRSNEEPERTHFSPMHLIVHAAKSFAEKHALGNNYYVGKVIVSIASGTGSDLYSAIELGADLIKLDVRSKVIAYDGITYNDFIDLLPENKIAIAETGAILQQVEGYNDMAHRVGMITIASPCNAQSRARGDQARDENGYPKTKWAAIPYMMLANALRCANDMRTVTEGMTGVARGAERSESDEEKEDESEEQPEDMDVDNAEQLDEDDSLNYSQNTDGGEQAARIRWDAKLQAWCMPFPPPQTTEEHKNGIGTERALCERLPSGMATHIAAGPAEWAFERGGINITTTAGRKVRVVRDEGGELKLQANERIKVSKGKSVLLGAYDGDVIALGQITKRGAARRTERVLKSLTNMLVKIRHGVWVDGEVGTGMQFANQPTEGRPTAKLVKRQGSAILEVRAITTLVPGQEITINYHWSAAEWAAAKAAGPLSSSDSLMQEILTGELTVPTRHKMDGPAGSNDMAILAMTALLRFGPRRLLTVRTKPGERAAAEYVNLATAEMGVVTLEEIEQGEIIYEELVDITKRQGTEDMPPYEDMRLIEITEGETEQFRGSIDTINRTTLTYLMNAGGGASNAKVNALVEPGGPRSRAKLVCVATTHIKAGEEVTWNYSPDEEVAGTAARVRRLRMFLSSDYYDSVKELCAIEQETREGHARSICRCVEQRPGTECIRCDSGMPFHELAYSPTSRMRPRWTGGPLVGQTVDVKQYEEMASFIARQQSTGDTGSVARDR